MLELSSEIYEYVLPLVNSLKYNATFAYSVINKIQPGKIFVDQCINPTCSLIISGSGKYLVVGNSNNQVFMSDLIEFLGNEYNHSNYYDLYISTEDWIEEIQNKLDGQVVLLYRSSFVFNELKFQEFNSKKGIIPIPYVLKQLDRTHFLKYRNEIDPMYNSLWSSEQSFMEKGFGFCILVDTEFASVCNSYFVGGGKADIDIVTIEKYRRNGLATHVCVAFIEYCLEHNLVPTWDCDAGNQRSIQLATKLGFEKNKDMPMFWWHQNKEVITNYLKKYNYSTS
ncbi:GNAT family N-acetyltransferase [Paenibacillus periandrae]|uniref:GNAT family N-acetyltransferase n=1 Tax=Paenibacillus periandrae TaxID=1761741 RepID=UPI001F0991FC|nr:GNAT family N-acetyltransferase [Paenibacillus periandrae]